MIFYLVVLDGCGDCQISNLPGNELSGRCHNVVSFEQDDFYKVFCWIHFEHQLNKIYQIDIRLLIFIIKSLHVFIDSDNVSELVLMHILVKYFLSALNNLK